MSINQIILIVGVVSLIAYVPLFFWVIRIIRLTKKLQERNLELQANEDALNSTTTELINAEKFALIGKTYSALAHEINTPLAVVHNSTERIRKKEATLEDSVKADLTLIYKASLRAQVIVKKFLQSTRNKINNDHCNIHDVFKDWHSLYGEEFKRQGISIENYIASPSTVLFDSASAFQVLNNIIGNAIDAVHNNNEAKEIRIISRELENYVEVSIQDNGPGFPHTILDDSFRPFRTSKGLGRGTGIGLWLVYNIMQENGGQIELGNTMYGAVVNLYFPLND